MRLSHTLLLACVAAAPQRQKVYSIGDLHGDYDRFKDIMSRLGLAAFTDDYEPGNIHWTGGTSILVSTGDTVDRGLNGRPIYLAFQELSRQAMEHGGEVVNLVGNHELMNLQGDLRYVHPSEMDPNGDYGGREGRAREWARQGIIGRDIRKRYVAAAVRQGTLFVHGGMNADTLMAYGQNATAIDRLNEEVRNLFDAEVVAFNHKLFGAQGPFWNRFFAEGGEAVVCEKVENTLQLVGADRMVIGHTPQTEGVNVRCASPSGPKIILGDTIISRAYERSFGFSRASAIEYDGRDVTVHYFPEGQEGTRRVPIAHGRDEM